MELTLPKNDILKQLVKQLSNFFVISEEDIRLLNSYMDETLQKCEYNFSNSENKYYRNKNGVVCFDVCHSIQWMTFLYYLSNTLYSHKKGKDLCDKIYYLNKIMNGVDLLYAIELPSIFGAEHPLGTIMGRAEYGDGFFFYQGCTVGGYRDKEGNLYYPKIGNNVRMYAHSAIIGKCVIGNNAQIGAGAIVKNQDVPDNSVVFGESPNLIVKLK